MNTVRVISIVPYKILPARLGGEKGIAVFNEYVGNEVSITAIVCNKTNVGNLVDNIGKMKSLKTIVYTNDSVAPDDKIDLPKPPRGVVISSFDGFVASGDTAAFPPTPPKSGTCAVIMYTSGSTGKVSVF